MGIIAFLMASISILFITLKKWRTRYAFIATHIILTMLILFGFEILSLFKGINYHNLTLWWSVIGALSLFYCIKSKAYQLKLKRIHLTRVNLLIIGFLLLLVLSTFLIAVVAAPNNWDSMTYHLSRIVHWKQNQSLAFYPTDIQRQLHSNPLAEYISLNTYILTGSDQFLNLTQWIAMFMSLMSVSLIAEIFGANIFGQIAAVSVCFSLPMGILQSTSTQNDYVLAFFITAFVLFTLKYVNEKKGSNLLLLFAGMTLGFAILTKATAYLFSIPFIVWFSVLLVREKKYWPIFVVAALVLIINFSHYYRNYSHYRSILGPTAEGEYKYLNEKITPKTLLSNSVRNAALSAGTPFLSLNNIENRTITKVFSILKISISDPKTTWTGTSFGIMPITLHEDYDGYFVSFILLALSLYCITKSRQINSEIKSYIIAITAAFLLFSLILKWQPWNNRLLLPLFVLTNPFIGLCIGQKQKSARIKATLIIILISTIPWVYFNKTRPVFGAKSIFTTTRVDQYFINRPTLIKPYLQALKLVHNEKCNNVGLKTGEDGWEYPFWALSRIYYKENINFSSQNSRACAIITVTDYGKNASVKVIR